MKRAVFLDRDGVLNEAVVREGRPYPPHGLEELRICADAPEALAELKRAGFLLIVATNQNDVAHGTLSRDAVDEIHAQMKRSLPIDDILVCFHDDPDGCRCRKPNPGMLEEAAGRHSIDLASSFMVGDRWKDVEAGLRAGCRTVWIDRGYREEFRGSPPHFTARSLREATDWVLGKGANVSTIEKLKVKIFADGADKAGMLEMYRNPHIQGFTTNPTLMRKANIADYAAFATGILDVIRDRPISFEVFSDEFAEMERQARKIAAWGKNVYVKIPVTNTRGESSLDLARRLSRDGVQLNVTALMTLDQVRDVARALEGGAPAFVSVFAGRIADTGRDPIPLMAAAVEILKLSPNCELIWASPRELLNIFQADAIGCHVITVTNDVLAKLSGVGKDLRQFSLETVQMFRNDAVKAGFSI